MKKLFEIGFVLFLILTFFSCGKDSSCLKNTGKQQIEDRSIVSNITEIILKDNIDLVLTQDSIPSLKVEGGENLLPYINTTINGNTIEITNDNNCNFLRSYDKPVTVYLSIPNIHFIDYTGYGNITTTNTFNLYYLKFDTKGGTGSINMSLNVEDLEIKGHTGPADFTISGKADKVFIFSGGQGWFYMENLLANSMHVSHEGTGDVIVNVKNDLRVELRSLGNVVYYGNPIVNLTEHTGNGEVIKK